MCSARLWVSVIAVTVLVASVACVGPQGPPGPPGPSGSGGGPPYVWVCTPISFPNVGSNTRADLAIFNTSSTTANVAVHIFNKDGVNLTGQNVPGSNPAATYPGQTGSATVPVASMNTLTVTWQTPQTYTNPPGIDPTKISATVHVVSDQPVVVGINIQWNGQNPIPCSLSPK